MADILPSVNFGNDISSYRISGAAADRWYTIPIEGAGLSAIAIIANSLSAIPFVTPKTITLDRIAVNVTIGAALSNIRLGIYIDNGNVYPGALILDAGTVSSAVAGVKTIVINQQLNKNSLYWLVLLSDGIPTIRSALSAPIINMLGFDNTLPATMGASYSLAFAYAPLPNPFPTGATFLGAAALIFVRLL